MIKQRNVTIKTATTTITVGEMGDILCNSAITQTYTLPAVFLGLWYRFSNINTGVVTISNGTTIATIAQNEQCLILNNGTTWYAFVGGSDIPFTKLTDVPADYTDAGSKFVKVNVDATGLEFVVGEAIPSAFTDLTDTPNSYAGSAEKIVAVNIAGDALEFIDRRDTTPPSVITNFVAAKGNNLVTLTWTNPIDSDFAGLKILRKTGSYPTGVADGTLIYTGANTSYIDTTAINGTTYYYRAFPYDWDNNINITTSGQQVTATPAAPVVDAIYGVKIDTTNSNPLTALTYTDDAIGFTPALGNDGTFNVGSWADKFPFNAIKPCLYKNGVVNYYLNPNDYTQKVDGVTASDITIGADGDVMIEFPKIYWKFETIGSDLYIRFSGTKIDSTYKCLAHMRGLTEKDFCYISAYMGYDLASELRSLSGKTPTVNQTIGAVRTLAQANGVGYDQIALYQLSMLQILYIVMFKSRDSQTALGRGYLDGNASSIATGGANAKGMFYGETTGKLQNKFCGIEDFYGNTRYWIDGFFSSANRNMLIANQTFNDTGSGYVDYGVGAAANIEGYIDTVQGGTETGFIVKTGAGSATTHYADYGLLNASCLAYFGESWAGADIGGAFSLVATDGATYSYGSIGARLMYL